MKETFELRGTVIRMARLMRNLSVDEFSKLTGISPNYVAIMEREEATISHRNYYRFLRALRRDLKVSDQTIAAFTLIVEFEENKQEVLKNEEGFEVK
ncbi:helix-turn-helix domain-containing protein [Halobacillus sp. A5]|uniref:helix-turn-helix domain-containing protein n=1 Tax=Halobacillus sp. A5 TaxID=2880263 RepID=UPI0020A6B69E|nr:helix-turn-helix transcriptional regulator [Halobacillus sp. A5]MCP3026902.1 helix-turn-helix transcriptional regulator [Halobacillus sp. A5]